MFLNLIINGMASIDAKYDEATRHLEKGTDELIRRSETEKWSLARFKREEAKFWETHEALKRRLGI